MPQTAPSGRKWVRPAITLGAVLAVIVLLRVTGLTRFVSAENVGHLQDQIARLGVWGPVAYIALYVAACLFFVPGIPVTLLAGVFGALAGTVYVSIGSTMGAAAAFLVARYAMRPMVERWAQSNPAFQRIDAGVRAQGWRMVMITRLVPLFPFNLQNYAYGLTGIPFWTYVFVSWLCMLPATVVYVFAGGSLVSGKGDIGKTLFYLAVAAVIFVLLSFLPGRIRKRFQVEATAARRMT